MASFALASVTIEELKLFHSIDRQLYTRLVINLRRDPGQSMEIIALWLLLEQMGYPNIILKMLPLSDSLVNAIADEAVLCLNCLESPAPPPASSTSHIPLTMRLMEKDISLQSLHENRVAATTGITKTVNDVCARAFDDIVPFAMRNIATREVVPPREVRATGEGLRQLMVPVRPTGEGTMMFPHPLMGGTGGASSHSHDMGIKGKLSGSEMGEGSNLNPLAQPWNPNEDVPQEERTLFVTFSRGYPMTEGEVREFFSRNYGDCIEDIYMQDVPAHIQPLYARIILRSGSKIMVILDGKDKAKFVINGKHVWARRYVAKRSQSPPPADQAI